jgi:aminoglycoside 2''-phosphotransferase
MRIERMTPPMALGRVRLAALVKRIRVAFPALSFDHANLNDLGEDHAVVVLDDAWVFRFPRNAQAASYAAGERRLLTRLNQASDIPTPQYHYVSNAGDFGGYRMIAGRELTATVFAELPRESQGHVLDELGGFLAVLHALPPELIAGPDGADGPGWWSGADYARRYRERRPTLAAALPQRLLASADRFFEALPEAVDDAPKVLTHSDLTEDHILLADGGIRLAGLIDFTDARRGDPAFDFACLWAYGDWAPARAATHYQAGAEVDAILRRSLWWYVRYSIDQCWEALIESDPCGVGDIAEQLPVLFAALKL